jgi:hypothetical protein
MGCTDKRAKNFNPIARVNNGTCIYDSVAVIYGCTDPTAKNYNPYAKIDNNNCTYQTLIPGCTDSLALNFNHYANVKDGSCKYPIKIWGCTDRSAANFNPMATHMDGYCEYVKKIFGCTDRTAYNYNKLATHDNKTCIFPELVSMGCTNKRALNYNPNATKENGTCIFETVSDSIKGCMDKTALNYNPIARIADNTKCVYNPNIEILGCTSPMALNYNKKATKDNESCIFARPVNLVVVTVVPPVNVVDTLGNVVENSCMFNFRIPIDSVYIISSKIVSVNEVEVEWGIKQGANVFTVKSVYKRNNQGTTLLYLSLVCNNLGTVSQGVGAKHAPANMADGSSVNGVTVSSYFQSPAGPTDVSETKMFNSEVVYYPVPMKDKLNVNIESKEIEMLEFNVVSIDGRLITSTKLSSRIGINKVEINTTELPKGIYVLTMKRNGIVFKSSKLSKN